MFLNLRLLSVVIIVRFVRAEFDAYLNESRQECSSENNLISCAKYKTLTYLSNLGQQYGVIGNESINSPVRLVRLEQSYAQEPELFPSARQMPVDSEFTKFLKFVQRKVNYYVGTQGIAFDLPEGARIIHQDSGNGVGEARRKKKKAAILLPLLILFKVFKIKLMMVLILGSLMFIKKTMFLAALLLPSIIQKIKHCISHNAAPSYYHGNNHDFDDFGTASGSSGGYSNHYERMYRGYGSRQHN